ncbi:MAG: hypothetical protein GWO22_28105, partial [Actinobacteria bacterium]|nr:hypothetical protein [Actinomycetota bacterium]
MTAVAVAGIVGLSRMPTPVAGVDGALLRLSWRLRGVSIEECRTLSREELEALPAHMRRTEECTGRTVGYLLRVDV